MQIINTWAELFALADQGGVGERLRPHAQRLVEFDDQPLSDLCEILLVEPYDSVAELEARVGSSLHPPPWEYVDHEGGWYELVVILSDDGFGRIVLVEDSSTGSAEVLAYCRSLAA